MIAIGLFLTLFLAVPIAFGTLKHVWIALDQLLNACFRGWPDETLSSRAWRWEQNGKRSWPRKLIDALLFFDPEHCRESFESERLGRQLPPELRSPSR